MRSKATSCTYDKAGNRLTETVTFGTEIIVTTYKYNEQNRLEWTLTQSDGISEKTQYQYDSNGNMISSVVSRVVPGDSLEPEELELFKQGTKANSDVTIYEYDLWNRLSWSLSSGKITEYEYNGEGRRTEKTVDGETTRYLYEYDKVVLEVDGNNAQTARNVYGINLIARSAESTTLYYMYNGHADVVALLDISCIIQAQYYYDAFGNILEQSGIADNPIRYAGYQYDEETGLYYLNARYYDSKIARFISEDTYRGDASDPLSLNLYTYCHNEPVMYWDPTGHWEQGDEYLNDNAKAAIIALTNAYYEATTDFERNAIHSQAEAVRTNISSYDKKVTPLSLESYDTIYDAVDSGVAARGYMTKEEWVDAVYSVGVTYATKTQYNGDSYSVKKETNTVTSIGRSDLTVNINSDSKYRTAYTRIGLRYNLTPNEQKFVESTSYNPAESVCILDVMNKNKGEITESELENIVGDNYHKTRWWGKILPGLDPSTADILEMQYKFTNKGFSIEKLSYMRFSEKFTETFAAFYIHGLSNAMYNMYDTIYNPGPSDPFVGGGKPSGVSGNVNPKDIKPTGWSANWEWRYGTRGDSPRWFDPNGGEWRLHTPDAHHTITHWDYNPWTDWNSQWRNLTLGGDK